MNKKVLQSLAEARVADARTLLNAVECALKACIAKKTKRPDFPDKDFARDVYTHNLADLVRIAGLREQLKRRSHEDPTFETKWVIVKDWSEKARYEVRSPQREARRKATAMLNAVEDREGILACIQQFW